MKGTDGIHIQKKTTTKNKTCHNYILFGSFCEHEDELPSDILKQSFQIRLQANWQDDVEICRHCPSFIYPLSNQGILSL